MLWDFFLLPPARKSQMPCMTSGIQISDLIATHPEVCLGDENASLIPLRNCLSTVHTQQGWEMFGRWGSMYFHDVCPVYHICLRCSGIFLEHFLPVKNGCFCAGFGESLRVHSWPLCCWRTSLLQLEDLLLMFWCYIMLVHVAKDGLVLISLHSVSSLITYDVICVKTHHLTSSLILMFCTLKTLSRGNPTIARGV